MSPRFSGIAFMLTCVAVFALMDAALKALVAHYPPFQVTALRGITSLPFVMLAVTRGRAWGTVLNVRWSLHLLRGVLALFILGGFVFAVRDLPLADTYCLFFIAPLLITAFSVPLLKEKVDGRRWMAIACGLLGVILMLRPSGQHYWSWGTLAILLAAIGYSLAAISVRVLARSDSIHATTFWFTFLLSLLSLLSLLAGSIAVFDWVPLQLADWPWLLVVGLCGAVAQHCITEAFHRAPASLIAPFEYSALLWGVLLDYLLWNTTPNWGMLPGALIVIGSGLFVIWQEKNSAAETVEISAHT